MTAVFKLQSLYISISFLLLSIHVPIRRTHGEQITDCLEIELLSQLALLMHHPQSLDSNNVTESFFSLVEDLRNQNLTVDHSNISCSSLSEYPMIPKAFCTDGAFFKCMSANDMLELVPKSMKSVSEALAHVCPLLLLQLHSSACDTSDISSNPSLKPSSAAVWVYGFMFVTAINFCSIVGVLILPFLHKNIYHVVLTLFEGLAVGSLLGSSLFHLIPQTFKLVGHDKEHNYLWKSLLVFGGIYLFYVSERLTKIIINLREISLSHETCLEMTNLEMTHEKGDLGEKEKSTIGSVAWMIIFGDAFHNFIDGLSIGAAFSESVLAGISISVAVICEEFPHELGDFAVLLNAGMTMRQALKYNFFSATTCYVGLVIGVFLGDLNEVAFYIFALAGGMFFYIALVPMMGELDKKLKEAHQSGMKQHLKVFLIQNIGIILGVIILFVMARYAEHFNFENSSAFVTSSEEVLDDRVKQL